MKLSRISGAALLLALCAPAAARADEAPAPSAPVAAGSASAADYSTEIKLLYRIVACAGDDPLPANIDGKVVEAHCKAFLPMMKKYREHYLPMASKLLDEVRPKDVPTTVVYPFGGGDLLSALTTYPDATEVTTMSLEHAGDPRRIRNITPKALEDSLKLIRETIAGLVTANDSKSVNLSKGQRGEIPGQIAFFVVGLALHDMVPVGLSYFKLNDDGTVHLYSEAEISAEEKNMAKSLKNKWVAPDFSETFDNSEIRFLPRGAPAGTPVRIHRHMAANLSDDFLSKDNRILKHLEAKGTVSAMTKAASYLLWNDHFSLVRKYLLSHMAFMISDSTGIPPKFAKAAGFEQLTYGKFERSFLPASEEYNEEFRKLWTSQPERKLPFRYGYIDGEDHFHLLVTRPAANKGASATTPDSNPNPSTGTGTSSPTPAPKVTPASKSPTSTDGGSSMLETPKTPSTSATATASTSTSTSTSTRDGTQQMGIGYPLPDGGVPAEAVTSVPTTPPAGPQVTEKDVVEGGKHWRLFTEHGAIHVWRPQGYVDASAGTALYLHGYYANVDQVWELHHLAAQFRSSGRNALFVVPEAPVGDPDQPAWDDLKSLLSVVTRLTHSRLPDGPVVALAHSGGFRQVVKWLDYPRLAEIILLDGLYNNEDDFRAWLTTSKYSAQHRLVLVSKETADNVESFLENFSNVPVRNSLPERVSELSHAERNAQLLWLNSQYEHMDLVLNNKVIPMLYQLTPLGGLARKAQ